MKRLNKENLIFSLIMAALIAVASFSSLLFSVDHFLRDKLYNQKNGTNPNIVIVGVDEETLEAYGDFNTWSREKTAELIEMLSSNEETAPAVIGVDFMFVDEKDSEADAALKEACDKYGNVVFATNLVYRGALKKSGNEYYYDMQNVDKVELPYEGLREKAFNGYSNTLTADDGMVRYTSYAVDVNGNTYNSFAYKIYSLYMDSMGEKQYVPKTNGSGQYEFFFSGNVGEFSHVSLCEVLAGNTPQELYDDAIVLLGAYAPGFQDAYPVGGDRGNPMHGIEIHANIIQALMEEKTATDVSQLLISIITFILLVGVCLIGNRIYLSISLIMSGFVGILYTLSGVFLAKNGISLPIVYVWLGLVLSAVYFVIKKYALEKWHRKRTLAVFKKYVAPQVVDELAGTGHFEITLGGENRDIAVLFVDIRGFTPLSEGLAPEKVVGILNEYLAHTTECIFKHGGTLDKFIGDATMAVFNAPFDQEDYEYQAVATAWDIAKGGEKMQAEIEQKYGRKVNFGVGVNCGPAVVGNIGCDFRMDYTAIGDTVNTAARLESNAKAGQVLISDAIYQKVKDRVSAQSIGTIPLKGKSTKIEVFEVTALNES